MHPSLCREVVLTGKAMRAQFDAALADAGASLVVWIVLNQVEGTPALSQRELAARMQIEGPTLTRHLDRMEADRLIRRRPHPSDRRKIQVEATAAGRQLVRRLRRVAEETERATLAGIPARDLAALRRVLSRIESNIEGADAVAG
jgi:MarR family transcriptional regulator for hemolysin